MNGYPWWLTAIGGAFAGGLAIIEFVIHGTTGTFGFLAFVAIVFIAASFSRDGALREVLVWIGIRLRL
jgi:hypothetical protein